MRRADVEALPTVATAWHEGLGIRDLEVLKNLLVFHFDEDGLPVLGPSVKETYCFEPFCLEIATDFLKANKTKEALPKEESRLWLRGGNKWAGIAKQMFLPDPDTEDGREIQAILSTPENLDRALYKSSGAPALAIQAERAARELHEYFRRG